MADLRGGSTVAGNQITHSGNLESQLNTVGGIGDKSTLTTDSKDTIVNAINELDSEKLDKTGNAPTASKLATARTITISGDASGSATFDGSSNITITTTVADDSHNHTIANVDGLQTALDGKLGSTANATSASKLATPRTIALAGDLSGSTTFDGSSNISITATVADNSHAHNQLSSTDDRDVKPNVTPKGDLSIYFTSKEGLTGVSGTDYQDLLVLNGYTDSSGGKVNALSFDKSTQSINYYQAEQSSTTWGTPKTLAYTDSNITGNSATSSKWATSRTITLAGDATGSVSFDGSANATLTVTVKDDSHNHTIANIDGLQTALDSKASNSATGINISDSGGYYTSGNVEGALQEIGQAIAGVSGSLINSINNILGA